MTTKFTQFNLDPRLVQAVDELGYSTPTEVQENVIPPMLECSDVIVQSQTGGAVVCAENPVYARLSTTAAYSPYSSTVSRGIMWSSRPLVSA